MSGLQPQLSQLSQMTVATATPALKNEDSRNQELSAVGKQFMGLKSVDEGTTQFVDKINLKAQVESTRDFKWNQCRPVQFGNPNAQKLKTVK